MTAFACAGVEEAGIEWQICRSILPEQSAEATELMSPVKLYRSQE
jgi:hypothetical protein